MISFDAIFSQGPVIPVLSFRSVDEAVATSRTLFDAGIRVFEITLRHESALDAIASVIADLPKEAIVGAGTVTSQERVDQALAAGAAFGVSPGLTSSLAKSVNQLNWPLLPGIATISEAMSAQALGFKALKFFPAEVSGGTDFLKAAATVLPDLQFCPTGGLNLENAPDYLSLPNVPVIGGSWMVARKPSGEVDQEETSRKVASLTARLF